MTVSVPRRAVLYTSGLVMAAVGGWGLLVDPPWRHAVAGGRSRSRFPTPGPAQSEDGDVRGPQYHVDAGPKTIAITFDDGPDPRYTPFILDELRRHHVTATFCMIGEHAARHPDLVARVVDEGHALANHTWSHPNLRHLRPAQIRDQIEKAADAIESASRGNRPGLFRAPFGTFTPAVLSACSEYDLRPLAWSVDPRDWSRPGSARIAATVLDRTRTGAIIINHDGGGDRSQTLAAVRTYLPRLIAAGYRFTTPFSGADDSDGE
ncbi:polysaccharide deacetylase family protein [Streptomyces sp. RPT161]|uniref:polysaccharide deacetylase family protein n=1 Tax=Streptomyces sp. RPT161 TaxID=3015993 RepID=UPI0022B891A8|nr:polysaccharide deacetylase family protein [Streptomyces sp. RPT161]